MTIALMIIYDTICCNMTSGEKDQLKITSCDNVQLRGRTICLPRSKFESAQTSWSQRLDCSLFDSDPHPSEGGKLNSMQFTVMTFQNNEFVCSVQKLKLLQYYLVISYQLTSSAKLQKILLRCWKTNFHLQLPVLKQCSKPVHHCLQIAFILRSRSSLHRFSPEAE